MRIAVPLAAAFVVAPALFWAASAHGETSTPPNRTHLAEAASFAGLPGATGLVAVAVLVGLLGGWIYGGFRLRR